MTRAARITRVLMARVLVALASLAVGLARRIVPKVEG